ncbi:DUF1800 domain-containing protein [Psychroserpens damuponensis]|uniref:DUF1800 domain-containing protein n=1 Tax=Psychroserpens damuponensis TaxID=943936 RepID=UPI00058EDA20|nr:DUF1800 domain-containing protein [Psychroserpens damuponensis]
MNTTHFLHLYARVGFGAKQDQILNAANLSRTQVVDYLFDESKSIKPLKVDVSEFKNIKLKDLDRKTAQKLREKSRQKIKTYNSKWFERLTSPQELLREKMTLFWANHFVCRDDNILFVQQYNNTLRANALGNFGAFVKAVSKEAAMIKYLNNKQNRKLRPNENFARELMELFMLGVGNYTETDIKESARAFTGYNNDFNGNFKLRKFQHDEGTKTFLGQTGNFNGDDIINILLKQKQCARFICTKIYKYFVNDTVNNERIEDLTKRFYKDYDIERLMRYIFKSNWFYFDENIGAKIKSPIELLVGIHHIVPMTFKKQQDLFTLQLLLGQTLLNPPNVAGWKGGKNWIDSNTIMLRLKLPSIILGNAQISVKPKGEFEDTYEEFYAKGNRKKLIDVSANWEAFEKQFKNATIKDLETQLIITQLSDGTQTYLETLSQSSKREYCIQLMSLPEYQMC